MTLASLDVMRLRQVAQCAEDLGRAVAFYTDLLGSEPVAVFDPPGLAFFDLDGTRLLLDTGAPSALLYLQVDDVREAVQGLRARGAVISTEPHVVFPDDGGTFDVPGDEWLAFVTDSEGNEVGLMARVPRQP